MWGEGQFPILLKRSQNQVPDGQRNDYNGEYDSYSTSHISNIMVQKRGIKKTCGNFKSKDEFLELKFMFNDLFDDCSIIMCNDAYTL